ncbi:hypothetical protein Tco_1192970 [Tanacetum coccineum]
MNQTEPTFDHLFELNNLKAELQANDTTIGKFKENIKRLNKTSTINSVKKDINEIETISIELDHRVAKLITKNEHLKQTYKQLYDSIKPSCVHDKEHAKSLKKVFVITTLKNDLRKVKGNDIVDNAIQVSNAITAALGRYKLDQALCWDLKDFKDSYNCSFCVAGYKDTTVCELQRAKGLTAIRGKRWVQEIKINREQDTMKIILRLEYDTATAASPAVESFVNLSNKSRSDKGYHSVPPPLSGNFIPHKPDLTFIDEIVESENLDVTTVTVNGVRQLQALVDKKRVIITESSIRSNLHLDDAEGTDCLPTATIFEELTRIGAKSTAWNEFSSTMASLIICLATNQKFNLSKYIFDAMVKHLDGGVKFLMYPCFLQVFINQQLGDMSNHKKTFVNPFHSKKVFANMKRAGNDFSRRITPLFDTMMVQASEEVGENLDHPTNSNQIPIIDQPSISSQPKKKQKSKKAQRKEAEVPQDETEHEESVPTPSNDPQPSGEDSMQLNDLMVLCTKLQAQVLDLEKAKDAQAKEIAALKKRVQRLERKKKSRTTGLKRLKKVGMSRRVESSEDQESLGDHEDASKQGRSIEDIDKDDDVTLVDETQERQDDDLMFDTGVLDTDEMPVEAKIDEKDEQSTKLDDSTAGEAVTTASVEGSAAPTTIEEITLAQTLIQIKAAKPKVVTTAATTTTTTRPKARGVVVQEPSEFRTPQEVQPSITKDKGKGIMVEPEVPLKRKDQVALDEQMARDIQAKLDAELIEEEKLARKQEEEANIALIES